MPRARFALPLLLAVVVSGCGHGSTSTQQPAATPTPSVTEPPAADARAVRNYLRDIAIAEETYYTDAVKYLPFTGKAPKELWLSAPAPRGAEFGVAVLSSERYCAVGAAAGGYLIWDSQLMLVTTKAALTKVPAKCKVLARALVKAQS